ncbi:MAG: hypothetical protein SPE95_08335, partial [Oscillospiraceae bacterium]|nr:hypothetical protein [Oscillospiraceae bacterium]
RLRPVRITFGNFLKCSQNHLKGSVQASILFNFQGPVCSLEAAYLLYQASARLSSAFLIFL